MQEKDLHEYVYPLKRKPTEIVIRIKKRPICDSIITNIKTDTNLCVIFSQHYPPGGLIGNFDGVDMNKFKKDFAQSWFNEVMNDISADEEVKTLLVNFIGDDIEIGGF